MEKSDFAHVDRWKDYLRTIIKERNFVYNRIMVPSVDWCSSSGVAVTFKRRRDMVRQVTRSWARREGFTLDCLQE